MRKLIIVVFILGIFSLIPDEILAQETNVDLGIFSQVLDRNGPPRNPEPSEPSGPSGGGNDEKLIITNWANESRVLPKSIKIRWWVKDSTINISTYEVIIAQDRGPNSNPVFKIATKANSIMLPLDEIHIIEGINYFVQVKNTNGDEKSRREVFKLADKEDVKNTIATLKLKSRYIAATPSVKLLMKAFAFENLKMHQNALKIYEKYQADDETDIIFRNMKDDFKRRNNMD